MHESSAIYSAYMMMIETFLGLPVMYQSVLSE